MNPKGYTYDSIRLIMFNTLMALSYLHKANVIHRDIKPANILINDACEIKFCDFGLARTMPRSNTMKGSGNSKRIRDSLFKRG